MKSRGELEAILSPLLFSYQNTEYSVSDIASKRDSLVLTIILRFPLRVRGFTQVIRFSISS